MTLLSILMPGLRSRDSQPLIREIFRQIRTPDVEFLADIDNGERTSGQKRNDLTARVKGDYLAFVDDDDWVSPDYVAHLREGCLSGREVVCFDVMRSDEHAALLLRLSPEYRSATPLNRCVMGFPPTHLCAWRRDVAARVAWDLRLGYGDDCAWYKPLLAAGYGVDGVRVPGTLYTYQRNWETTANGSDDNRSLAYRLAGRGVECFRRDDAIFIAWDNLRQTADRPVVFCRDSKNRNIPIRRDEAERYYVWRQI